MEKFENLHFGENQTTCSSQNNNRITPCPNMSSVNFDEAGEPYWKCLLFNEKLEDDENKFLKRCDKCINHK